VYIIKTICFKRNPETLRPTGNIINRSFEAETVREAMAMVNAEKLNHDVLRETPIEISEIINTEE